MGDTLKSAPGTPKSSTSNPLSSPKSPSLTSISPSKSVETAPSSSLPSPLLLATSEGLTPLNSRDEESALYSDSDAGTTQSGGRGRSTEGASRGSRSRSKATKGNSGRGSRRKSDSSEKSYRSMRSVSAQRDKVPPPIKIFRNLLILEESLRQQCQDQRSQRRKFTAFLATLAGIEGFTLYRLYFDATPTSAVMTVILQFISFFIVIVLVLFQLSGEYRRTIVIPRRFFTSTNKGLRQLNLRLVKVEAPFGDKFSDGARSLLRMLVTFMHFVFGYSGSTFKASRLGIWVQRSLRTLELRAQPRVGATDVKLVLNPRAFNSEIRESWELYRDEFWAKEGSRRRHSSGEEDHNHSSSGNKSSSTEVINNDNSSAYVNSKKVLDRESLVEKHRKERKDRRRSKVADDRAGAVASGAER